MSSAVQGFNQMAESWWPWMVRSQAQALVVFTLVLGVLLVWRRASPGWRYALLLIALVKFAIPPIGPSFGLFSALPSPLARPPTSDIAPVEVVATGLPWEEPVYFSDKTLPADTRASAVTVDVPRPDGEPPESARAAGEVNSPIAGAKVTPAGWGLVVQILGSVGMVILVIGQAIRLRRKLGRAQRVSGGRLFAIAADAGRRIGLRRLPAMYVDGKLRSPQTGGLLRPFVLLPRWVEGGGGEEQAALVSHELAHVARRDSWVNWFQIAVQGWLWWNPLVWWLNRKIRTERELCCDDLVLGLGIAGGESYSRTLLGVAGRLTRREATMQVLGMADTFVSLKSRVARILDTGTRRPVRLSVFSIVALGAFAILVLPGSSPARWDNVESKVAVTNEEAGDAGVNDISAQAPETPAPPRGAGRSFDGVDDFLEVPDSEALDIGDFFTVEAWVKSEHVTGQDAILSKEVPWKSGWTLIIESPLPGEHGDGKYQMGGDRLTIEELSPVEQRRYPPEEGHQRKVFGIRFGVGNGDRFHDLVAAVPQTGPVVWKGTPIYQIGIWRHVAVIWNRGKGTIYVNGEPLAEDEFPGAAPARIPLRIGKGSADLGRHFNGELAEIRIWDVVRTPEEIEADMSKQLTGKEPGLIAYWPLDDPPGMVARDLTPNNRYARPYPTEEVNYLGQKDFPRIVSLDPPNGAEDVDPSREHITITFDRPMRNGYSWVDKGMRPKLDEVKWISDRECRALVTLEPGREYGVWLNFGPRTSHFRSVEGASSNRFYWSFRTEGGPPAETSTSEALPVSFPAGTDFPDSMVSERGCEVATENGFVVLTEGTGDTSYIRTKESFRPPVVLKTRAMTDSTNIRLYHGDYSGPSSKCGIVIFNWEMNPEQLRIHDPLEYNIRGVPGEGYVTPGEWHDIAWEIRPDLMIVRVDGEERFRWRGDFAAAEGTLGIGPAWGSKVWVQSFVVQPGIPEATPETVPAKKTEGPARPGGDVEARLAMPVTLTEPYPKFYEGSPTDKVSVQYAVIALLQQVGLNYDWDTSYKNTDPICRKWIYPEISDVPCRDALHSILEPVGLEYEMADGRVFLKKLQTEEQAPSSGADAAPPPKPVKVSAAPDQDPVPEAAKTIGLVDDTAEGKKSLGASGHSVEFERPEGLRFLEAVRIAASRYGTPVPPAVDFHLYVLDGGKRVLADVPFPYALIERGDLRWYTLRTPSIEIPERFFIALAFNPHQTKGIYLGLDTNVTESHSYIGLPETGFEKVEEKSDWMIRAYLSAAPSKARGLVKMTEGTPAEPEMPRFASFPVEVRYDDGVSDGRQSYEGAGPALQFHLTDSVPPEHRGKYLRLAHFSVYGNRYGSGYDPVKETVTVSLIDPQGKVVGSQDLSYGMFKPEPGWQSTVLGEIHRHVVLAPEEIQGVWTIAIDPHATRTKGVFFHYNQDPEQSHSLRGTVEGGFEPLPGREWMIRLYFDAYDLPVHPFGR